MLLYVGYYQRERDTKILCLLLPLSMSLLFCHRLKHASFTKDVIITSFMWFGCKESLNSFLHFFFYIQQDKYNISYLNSVFNYIFIEVSACVFRCCANFFINIILFLYHNCLKNCMTLATIKIHFRLMLLHIHIMVIRFR